MKTLCRVLFLSNESFCSVQQKSAGQRKDLIITQLHKKIPILSNENMSSHSCLWIKATNIIDILQYKSNAINWYLNINWNEISSVWHLIGRVLRILPKRKEYESSPSPKVPFLANESKWETIQTKRWGKKVLSPTPSHKSVSFYNTEGLLSCKAHLNPVILDPYTFIKAFSSCSLSFSITCSQTYRLGTRIHKQFSWIPP